MTTGQITKRIATLADGRELIYFDDADTTLAPDRRLDARILDPRPETASMRQDVLTGDWVSMASARQNRAFLPPAELDPLAPASPTNPSEVPDNYDVAVFENRSPSFGPLLATDLPTTAIESNESDVAGARPVAAASHERQDLELRDLVSIGLNRTKRSVGRCEVVCFSPEHAGSYSGLSVSRSRTVVEAWADRTAALSALPGVQQVFPFENRGEAIGVTLHHPHGQIYGYPYITPRTTGLIRSLDAYGPTLFADVLGREQASSRVILAGKYWTAFVPFAARWPIEVHMLPHRHVPDLAETTGAERDELAALYLRLLRGIDALYDTETPYISAWHQAPVHARRDEIRLMLQVTSPRRAENKLKYLAGSEAAMGAWIGDVLPEDSAQRLRDAIARSDAQTDAETDALAEAPVDADAGDGAA